MKNVLGAIMLFGFLWTQFYNTAVVSLYELNKTAYIEEFCKNTDQPEMHCEGKCHLTEQLADTHSESTSNDVPSLLPQQDLFSYAYADEPESLKTKNIDNSPIHQKFYTSPVCKIDHPPKV